MSAHRGGGNAEFGARRGQVTVPSGHLKNDKRIHRGQGAAQRHHIEIILNPSKISTLEPCLFDYK
jgi:hypothetical protein